MKSGLLTAGVIAACTIFGVAPAADAAVSDFYKGKVVSLIVSAGGGSYTLIARTLARHMPRHLPGSPTIIVKNMPGAGHVRATNFMFSKAPKDGSYFATIGNSIPLHQAIGGKGVRFDARKFNWIGSTGITNLMTAVWHATGVKNIEDARKKEVISGGTGSGSGTVVYPTLMNNLLGTRFKIVIGYRRAGNIDLAMERGEVAARSGYSYGSLSLNHPDWLRTNKVNLLVQIGLDRSRGPAGVPLLVDLARNSEQREIFSLFSRSVALGRPYLAPPGVPADRLKALRQAFAATLSDSLFVKEQKKRKFDLYPTGWRDITKTVDAIVGVSPALVKKAKAAMKRKGTIDCKAFTDPKNCKSKKKKKKKRK